MLICYNIFKNVRTIHKYSYSFEGRRVGIVPKKSEEKSPTKIENKMLTKYKEVIKELKINSDSSSHWNVTAFDHEMDHNLNNIADLQNNLEDSALPMFSMLTYSANYNNYLYDLSKIKLLLPFNITFLLKEMFGINYPPQTLTFFVPDMEYLRNLRNLLNSTNKRYVQCMVKIEIEVSIFYTKFTLTSYIYTAL